MPHRPRKAAGRCKVPLMRFAADKKGRTAPIYRLWGRLTGRKRRIPCGIFRFRSRDTAFFNCPRRSPPTQAASRTGGVPPTGAPGGRMGGSVSPRRQAGGARGHRARLRRCKHADPARQGGGRPAREAGPWAAAATLPDHVQHARRKRRERDGARGHPVLGAWCAGGCAPVVAGAVPKTHAQRPRRRGAGHGGPQARRGRCMEGERRDR